jgi:hypothetical protein
MIKTSMLFLLLGVSLLANNAGAIGVTGTWNYDGKNESSMFLKTVQTGNIVRFQLELQRGAPSYNSGWIEGQFELHGNIGAYRSGDNGSCEIDFTFSRFTVQIEESDARSGCGFGYNVFAYGTLRRKTFKRPKFDKSDPRE